MNSCSIITPHLYYPNEKSTVTIDSGFGNHKDLFYSIVFKTCVVNTVIKKIMYISFITWIIVYVLAFIKEIILQNLFHK